MLLKVGLLSGGLFASLLSCGTPQASDPATAKSAEVAVAPTQCSVEALSWGKEQVDVKLTSYCQQRLASGWKLAGYSNGLFVWEK